jgi:hypothetical protein
MSEIGQIKLRLLNKIMGEIQVLTAASMKMAVLWVVAPCSLVEVYRCFRSTCRLHHQGDRRQSIGILSKTTT